jgi:hypothetical protein
MVDSISDLAVAAWDLHRDALVAGPPARVTPKSAPVLYFGDLGGYRASRLRVVTVGVNPSGEEFPTRRPWSRFPVEHIVAADDVLPLIPAYLRALNSYFEHEPYKRWFGAYEPALNGLGVSYYDGAAEGRALHTDVCTPVPTTPVWSSLERHEWRTLAPGGVALWHRLVDELEPHVILASIGARNYARIALEATGAEQVVYTVEQKRPLQIRATRVQVGGGHALLVTGGAATTPFQMINQDQRRELGVIVRDLARV